MPVHLQDLTTFLLFTFFNHFSHLRLLCRVPLHIIHLFRFQLLDGCFCLCLLGLFTFFGRPDIIYPRKNEELFSELFLPPTMSNLEFCLFFPANRGAWLIYETPELCTIHWNRVLHTWASVLLLLRTLLLFHFLITFNKGVTLFPSSLVWSMELSVHAWLVFAFFPRIGVVVRWLVFMTQKGNASRHTENRMSGGVWLPAHILFEGDPFFDAHIPMRVSDPCFRLYHLRFLLIPIEISHFHLHDLVVIWEKLLSCNIHYSFVKHKYIAVGPSGNSVALDFVFWYIRLIFVYDWIWIEVSARFENVPVKALVLEVDPLPFSDFDD